MTLPFKVIDAVEATPHVMVIGVGGAGGNAVDTMIEKGLQGVECVAANTDAQALAQSRATKKLQLGRTVTCGLGAGADPAVGAQAAEESAEELRQMMEGAQMVFVTAGMGGGTGTGAAPVVARIAREMGLLTVGVATKPFQFEGARRMRAADTGVAELRAAVDTLIVIQNQNLFRVANSGTSFAEAFVLADEVLYQGVKGVTDLMLRPGLMNLDFADVRAIMNETGEAMMGAGEGSGEGRAMVAAEAALENPLLDGVTLDGARGVLINICGGLDLTLFEVDEVANRVRDAAHEDASIIFGSTLDPELEGRVRVTVVATGIRAETATLAPPAPEADAEPVVSPPAPAARPIAPPLAATEPAIQHPAVVEPQSIESSLIDGGASVDEAGPVERRDVLVRKLAGDMLGDAAAEATRVHQEEIDAQGRRRSEPGRMEIPSFLRRHAN